MHIRLAGEDFDLEIADIIDRLASHTPNAVTKYSTQLGGVVWPVKQVLTVATGVSPDHFSSQEARSRLRKLGLGRLAKDGVSPSRLASLSSPRHALPVRIRQYVYFRLFSEVVTADAITEVLGVDPDTVSVRGSKQINPPVPVTHSWQLRSDQPGLTVDDQIEQLVHRLHPLEGRIRELVATTDVEAVLQIVRHFDAEDGEQEILDAVGSPTGEVLTKLAGQHQLLGWHLDAQTLTFLSSIGADIDCDEYGG